MRATKWIKVVMLASLLTVLLAMGVACNSHDYVSDGLDATTKLKIHEGLEYVVIRAFRGDNNVEIIINQMYIQGYVFEGASGYRSTTDLIFRKTPTE